MTLRLKIERTALFLFVGGISYGLLELLWRGRTHWTMLLLGGVCFLCIGTIRRKGFSLPLRSLLCALIVTALEFLTGCVVNLRLHWAVWDYSANRFQLLGQAGLRGQRRRALPGQQNGLRQSGIIQRHAVLCTALYL